MRNDFFVKMALSIGFMFPFYANAESCTVDAAGVTTFKDINAKIPGTSVRIGIDEHQFKIEKRLNINGKKILMGKLLDSDGKVLEQKSYVWEEEWLCKK